MSLADRIARWQAHWDENPPPKLTTEQGHTIRVMFGELQPANLVA